MASSILPGSTPVSQFGAFLGACGEAAASVLLAIETGGKATVGGVDALVRQLQAAGKADKQGQSTLGEEQWGLAQHGVSTTLTYDTASALDAVNQGHPVLLEVARGGLLPGHTDKGLNYHFVTLAGHNEGGYLLADSDTAAGQAGQLIQATGSQIAAAQPFGALIGGTPGSAQAMASSAATSNAVGGGPSVSAGGDPPGANLPFVGGFIRAGASTAQLVSNINNILVWLTSGGLVSIGLVIAGAIVALIGLAIFILPAAEHRSEQAAQAVGPFVAAAA